MTQKANKLTYGNVIGHNASSIDLCDEKRKRKSFGQNYLIYYFSILADRMCEGLLPAPPEEKRKICRAIVLLKKFLPSPDSKVGRIVNISLCSRNPPIVTIPFIIYLHFIVVPEHQ